MVTYRTITINSINYRDGFTLQKSLQQKVLKDPSEQYILLLQHPHVFTAGKRGFEGSLKHPESFFTERGIELVHTDRGGLVTYHGPGQLVVYFILDLTTLNLSIKQFVHRLEETIIETLNHFNIAARREPEYRGIFVEDDKICAIGLQQTRQVTTHGIALNINTDLNCFNWIIPCGITDRGVTSINTLVNQKYHESEIIDIFINKLAAVLEITIERT